MRKYFLFLTFVLVFSLGSMTKVSARTNLKNDYNYNFWGESIPSTPTYEFERTIDIKTLGVQKLDSVEDVFVAEDKIYIVDMNGNQIFVTDHDFNFITRIYQFSINNVLQNFNKPSGIYVNAAGDIYIADTQNLRIVVFGSDYKFKYVIGQPKNMIGNTVFKPKKIVVDRANRIYAVVDGGYEGILEINSDGSFSRYFGVNKRMINWMDFLWKRLMTEKQKESLEKTFAPPFNNLDIDGEGFIYATSSDTTSIDYIKRINPTGEDVLRKQGYTPPIGDLRFITNDGAASFRAITVNNHGMYAALDTNSGKVFIYNFDGELLMIFNRKGNQVGEMKTPTAISWFGDKIIVADRDFKSISVFRPTEFGQKIIDASKLYYDGKFNEAGETWKEVLEYNTNYDLAYVGIGKMHLMNENYAEAVKNFKLGNNRTYYSMAYKEYRDQKIKENFGLFVAPLLLLCGYIIYSEVRHNRKEGR